MWRSFWLNNDHVFPGLQCLSLAWGINHLRDNSQGQAQDFLGGQPHHDLACRPWPSWDMVACIEPFLVVLVQFLLDIITSHIVTICLGR